MDGVPHQLDQNILVVTLLPQRGHGELPVPGGPALHVLGHQGEHRGLVRPLPGSLDHADDFLLGDEEVCHLMGDTVHHTCRQKSQYCRDRPSDGYRTLQAEGVKIV